MALTTSTAYSPCAVATNTGRRFRSLWARDTGRQKNSAVYEIWMYKIAGLRLQLRKLNEIDLSAESETGFGEEPETEFAN